MSELIKKGRLFLPIILHAADMPLQLFHMLEPNHCLISVSFVPTSRHMYMDDFEFSDDLTRENLMHT